MNATKEEFDLREIFVMDSMHDQRITQIDLTAGRLSLCFEDLHFSTPHSPEATLYYNKHIKYNVCILTFSGLEDADLLVEVRKRTQSGIEITEYYDDEWIQFLQSNRFTIEVFNFYCGYRSVIILGALVAESGGYREDCMMKVSADTVVYHWQSLMTPNSPSTPT